jgi:hypothetical protein
MSWSKPHNTAPAKPSNQSGLNPPKGKNAGIFTGNKTPKAPPATSVPPARKGGTKV